jgi:hypothetical protein
MTPKAERRKPKYKRGDRVRLFSGHPYTIRSHFWDGESKCWRYKLYGYGSQYEPMESALKLLRQETHHATGRPCAPASGRERRCLERGILTD